MLFLCNYTFIANVIKIDILVTNTYFMPEKESVLQKDRKFLRKTFFGLIFRYTHIYCHLQTTSYELY